MSAEFLETLSAEARFALAQELHDALMCGNSIWHTSLVVSVCKDHNVPSLDWNEALTFCQEMEFEVDECPCCGWVSEGNYYQHPDHEEGVCDGCEEE